MVVIDFIDMSLSKHQRDVENRLKEALKADRARIQVGRISRFGLLEMSRQRLRLSLGESAQDTCPRCEGRGTVRNIQSHALSIVRLIEEEALKEKTAEIQVQLPVEMATFIMNEKRDFILSIEKRHSVHIVVVSNPYLQTPQYKIARLKEDNVGKSKKPSYSMIQPPEMVMDSTPSVATAIVEPAVKQFTEHNFSQQKEGNFFKKMWANIFGQGTKSTAASKQTAQIKSPDKRPQTAQKYPDHRHSNHPANRRRRPVTATQNHHEKPATTGKGPVQHKKSAPPKQNHSEKYEENNFNCALIFYSFYLCFCAG